MNFAAASARALAFTKKPAVTGIANVFALKGSAVILVFVLLSLAARVLGEHDFGTFSILFSAGGLLAVFATAGQQVLLMRSWNEYCAQGDAPHLRGALWFSLMAMGGVTLVVSALFFAVLSFFNPLPLAGAVTLYMALLGTMLVSMHLVRTAVSVGMGDGLGNLLAISFPVAYLLVCFLQKTPGDIATIFMLYSLGMGIAIVIQAVLVWRKVREIFPGFSDVTPRYDLPVWRGRSLRLWISNGLEAANQYVDVLIVGLLMSPSIAGAYFVTTRLANAFAVAAGAMHLFSSRHIPNHYFRGEFDQLDHMLDSVAKATLAIIIVGMVAVIGGGHWLLLAFSPAYVPYYGALALLCFGTAAVTAVGPSASILMFTGHEGTSLKIIAATLVLRAIGFFLLVPVFDVMGAVVATTLSFLALAVLMRNAARKLTGIDGSITRLLPGLGKTERTAGAAGGEPVD